ncbi:MAG: DedA family protein [Holophagae bacterium]|nr:DedA family protein [Holophagae bacterium]
MFKNLKAQMEKSAGSKWAVVTLAVVSFIESSFFPLPPDVILIPMVILKKRKWVYYSLVCTGGSVVGGLVGYLIGFQFYDHVAVKLIDFYHAQHQFELVESFYNQYGFFAVFTAGFTPIPYKVFTIAAGMFKMNIASFTIASIIGRGGRFLLEGFLIFKFGERAIVFMEKHAVLATVLTVFLVILAVILWKAWA